MSLVFSDVSVEKAGKTVVSDVSLSIAQGQLTALLGANGAGKSELVLGLAGVLPITRGDILLDGQKVTNATPEAVRRHKIAVVPQGHQVLTKLSIDDNLRAACSHSIAAVQTNLDYVYDIFPELAERKGQLAGTLSGGQQQMVALGHALMLRPRFLALDEMSLGLAPLVVHRLMGVVDELVAAGTGILLIEQFTDLALQHADHAVVLGRGGVAFSGLPTTLKQNPDILKSTYLSE
ncbi:ATP-binding cassette domain-containing protein [uncultured Tateyamaria sp.]|uniref:ABC transporter ATP-binding protein n=1 Tax=uncultured Tateyamaria sp. TaxID=455651 RepID=UPI002603CD36|nr:ATP-binding cassette domain-containing protein [uncultured Tateyamaria sp.]